MKQLLTHCVPPLVVQVLIFILIFFCIVILIKDVEPQPYNRSEFEYLDSINKIDTIKNVKNKLN